MQDYFPFHKQMPLGYIAPEAVEAFSLEQFRFAQDALIKAEGELQLEGRHIDKVVEASLKLIETTITPPKYARGKRQPEFFSTHPNPENRVEKIKAAIAKYQKS